MEKAPFLEKKRLFLFLAIILKCPKIHLPYDETPTMSDDSRRVGEINRKLIGKLTGPIWAWIGADQIELIDSDLYSLLGCFCFSFSFSFSLFQPSNPFGNFVSSSIPEDWKTSIKIWKSKILADKLKGKNDFQTSFQKIRQLLNDDLTALTVGEGKKARE